MHTRKILLNVSLGVAAVSLLTLAACDQYDMTPRSNFAEQTMQRHYQNGEMNEYQYQDNVRVFKRPPTSAAASTASGTGTAGGAGTSAPAASGSDPEPAATQP